MINSAYCAVFAMVADYAALIRPTSSSIRRLDKLSNIVKHCREQQLTMENPRAERPIRGADAGNASFRPRNRDGGRTHRHAREGEGTRIYHHRAPRGVGAILLPRRQEAGGRARHG